MSKKISEEKLNKALLEINDLQKLKYNVLANKFLNELDQSGIENKKLLREIRELSVDDKNNLKGDYVILAMRTHRNLQKAQEQLQLVDKCETCSFHLNKQSGGGRKPLTDDKIQSIRLMRQDGHTIAKIASELRMSTRTVQKYLK